MQMQKVAVTDMAECDRVSNMNFAQIMDPLSPRGVSFGLNS